MIVTIKPPIFERIKDDLVKLDVLVKEKGKYDEEYRFKGKGRHGRNGTKWDRDWDGEIDLTSLTKAETVNLTKALESLDVHGSRVLVADLKKFMRASEKGVKEVRARTVRQACWMLELFFAELEHHTIFSEDEYGGKSHSGYWVGDVEYQPEEKRRGERIIPEACIIDLWWVEDEARHKTTLCLLKGDCQEMTCLEILAKQGYVPETPALMAKLRKETERFYSEIEDVGKQCVAVGLGIPDLDDALTKSNPREHWGRRKLQLDRFGESRVVIDVLQEKDDEKSGGGNDSSGIDPYRWHKWNMRFHAPSEDELVKHLEADEDTAEPIDVDVPIHPLVPCYDLRRHVRLRVHVNNLTPYVYDVTVAEGLVLPERDWRMVNLLVDHSSNEFKDVVANKGRSMNVLSAGPPGTGKTLTAEVFAEFKKRPLYTIQCSQLGMDAESVEHNLGVIMGRANRWNAVLLLDEADVYICKREDDLNKNAIVGAFLRVLEYANCILFMTTNLGDSIDDAITSRCIAKLTYAAPSKEDQSRIWRILSDLNSLGLPDSEIKAIVAKHPHLTGRDVKNLLKLASMVSGASKEPLTAKTVDYCLQFKPTENVPE